MGYMSASGPGALRQMGRGAMGLGSLPNDPSIPGPKAIGRYLDESSETGEKDVGGVGELSMSFFLINPTHSCPSNYLLLLTRPRPPPRPPPYSSFSFRSFSPGDSVYEQKG